MKEKRKKEGTKGEIKTEYNREKNAYYLKRKETRKWEIGRKNWKKIYGYKNILLLLLLLLQFLFPPPLSFTTTSSSSLFHYSPILSPSPLPLSPLTIPLSFTNTTSSSSLFHFYILSISVPISSSSFSYYPSSSITTSFSSLSFHLRLYHLILPSSSFQIFSLSLFFHLYLFTISLFYFLHPSSSFSFLSLFISSFYLPSFSSQANNSSPSPPSTTTTTPSPPPVPSYHLFLDISQQRCEQRVAMAGTRDPITCLTTIEVDRRSRFKGMQARMWDSKHGRPQMQCR